MPQSEISNEIVKLSEEVGLSWFEYQRDTFTEAAALPTPLRACLYYRTGAGKTSTALALLRLQGHDRALVIAPPATHMAWVSQATALNMELTLVSHAKFRQQGFKTSRNLAIIADEFHLFGGHKGKGWVKFNRVAKSLQAPIVIGSATPNYNDVERCYCIQSVLDPYSVKGGFLEFLYKNCETEQNPFGMTPIVTGFRHHEDASSYLASLPGVFYVPDTSTVKPIDVQFQIPLDPDFETFGLDRSRGRIMASDMETRQRREYLWRVKDDHIQPEVLDVVLHSIDTNGKVMIFCQRATIATILADDLSDAGVDCRLITGKTKKADKDRLVEEFRSNPNLEVLVGTATIATGVDGLDKVCDNLILFDDTQDNSLRRQIMGRILPRGTDTDESMKVVHRYIFG
nr:MAG TPA_asm: Chromatin remodeling complex ATPase [Caudoviricetes sp.]